MSRICLIVVWMGPLPSYFPLWTRTLSANKAYDFLLVTDQSPGISLPSNLRVLGFRFDALRTFIGSRLSMEVSLEHPYKLCDFRPAYGEIFQDYLAEYSHWGHCDMDMLFGDLDRFITPALLDAHRKLFSRGHLTIYRNEPVVNAAYRSSRSIDHTQVFSTPAYCLFDEWHGIHRIFEELGLGQYNGEIMGDIKVYSPRLICTNIPNHSRQIFVWEEGHVRQYFLKGDAVGATELAYVHFQKRKIAVADERIYHSRAMILNPQAVLPYDGTITAAVIRKFDRADLSHYLQSQLKRIKKKIGSGGQGSLSFNKTLIAEKP
ncbi:MAG TPA: DUF6625 family protein [Puia sp.]|nr:DUF6625 family protein [Puia sp.]